MPEVEILCLANSRKLMGRCVAGLNISTMQWVRPVSTSSDGTLSAHQCILESGDEVTVLDVIKVSLIRPRPDPYQPENWVLANEPWHLVRRLTPVAADGVLARVTVSGPEIFGNRSDRVASEVLRQTPAQASLVLVAPENIQWHVTANIKGKRQNRAYFKLQDCFYDLPITDLKWEERLAVLHPGFHSRDVAGLRSSDRVLFTLSLGEPFNGNCFKLVAAVIILPAMRGRKS